MIRPNLVEIRQDLFEIRSDLAKTRDFNEICCQFLQNPAMIYTVRNQPIPNRRTVDIQPPEPLPSAAGLGLGDPIR